MSDLCKHNFPPHECEYVNCGYRNAIRDLSLAQATIQGLSLRIADLEHDNRSARAALDAALKRIETAATGPRTTALVPPPKPAVRCGAWLRALDDDPRATCILPRCHAGPHKTSEAYGGKQWIEATHEQA